jgi:hypothetical protein
VATRLSQDLLKPWPLCRTDTTRKERDDFENENNVSLFYCLRTSERVAVTMTVSPLDCQREKGSQVEDRQRRDSDAVTIQLCHLPYLCLNRHAAASLGWTQIVPKNRNVACLARSSCISHGFKNCLRKNVNAPTPVNTWAPICKWYRNMAEHWCTTLPRMVLSISQGSPRFLTFLRPAERYLAAPNTLSQLLSALPLGGRSISRPRFPALLVAVRFRPLWVFL